MQGTELARICSSAQRKFNPEGIIKDLQEVAANHGMFTKRVQKAVPEKDEENEKREEKARDSGVEGFPFAKAYNAAAVSEQEERNYLIHPLVNEGDVVILSAMPKAGKTLLTMHLCAHMAAGIPIGVDKLMPLDEDGKVAKIPVVYFALEGQGAIRKRVLAWQKMMGEEFTEEDLQLYIVEMPVNLTSAETKAAIVDKLVETNIYLQNKGFRKLGLVVFDTLTKAMPGKNQNSVEDTSEVFEVVDVMRECNLNCAVLFVHHNDKQNHSPRGSSNIMAEPDTLLNVKKGNEVVIGGKKYVGTLDLSVYMARSVDDSQKYTFAMDSISIGVNRQGVEEFAPTLVWVEHSATIVTKDSLDIEEGLIGDESGFYKLLISTVRKHGGIMAISDALATINLSESTAIKRYFSRHCKGRSYTAATHGLTEIVTNNPLPKEFRGLVLTMDSDNIELRVDPEEAIQN
jgi:hypothetical protein